MAVLEGLDLFPAPITSGSELPVGPGDQMPSSSHHVSIHTNMYAFMRTYIQINKVFKMTRSWRDDPVSV